MYCTNVTSMDGPTHWLYHRANVSPASSFEFACARRGEIPDADGFDSVLMGSECSPSSSAWPAKSLEAASLLADTVAAGIAENVAASFVVEGRFPFDELRFFVRRCFCEAVGAAVASPPSVAVTTVAGSVIMVPAPRHRGDLFLKTANSKQLPADAVTWRAPHPVDGAPAPLSPRDLWRATRQPSVRAPLQGHA